ncbi:DUF2812 domain-containing protein [Niallia sp. 01092]|uniref:DUF2812 domain-containing protein n=1 Tax=unclassified Niallia TaxID=2837522 RepID=UPI003FCF9783
MIKVFRPFWSYDVSKTEAWLSSMAKKGYLLVGLNRWTRCFFFRQDKSKSITYRIGYDKIKGVSLSTSLLEEDWVKVIQSGNWYVTSNEQPIEQIKTSSVRDGIIKHNRKIMYIFSAVLIYFLLNLTFIISTIGISLFQNASGKVDESPLWILTYTFFGMEIALIILSIYSVIKINKMNKYLIREKASTLQTKNNMERRLNKEKEKQLKRSGQMIVKRKFGWWYSPDKLEKWLETMEQRGYNLYRVNRRGTAFYFMIGSPRKVSYCADYQNISNESYFDMHRDAGWKSVFMSTSSLQKWTIWSREYAEGEERPQIYSDKSFHLKQARKVAITYTSMFFPIVILYIFIIAKIVIHGSTSLNLTNTVLILWCIFVFGSFTLRTWLYYMRIKKRYNFI